MYNLILLSAGESKRFDKTDDKAFVDTNGKPLIFYPLETFSKDELCNEITLVVREGYENEIENIVKQYSFEKVEKIITGGVNRIDSIKKAIDVVDKDAKLIAVHGITYPFVSLKELNNVYLTAIEDDGAVLGYALEDSIKQIDELMHIRGVESRKNHWITHAPTMARPDVWTKSYTNISIKEDKPTDEASILSRAGFKIQVVPDFRSNFPIYTTFDWERLKSLLK